MKVQTHEPVRVLGYGTYSTGQEAPDNQVRYGPRSAPRELVEYVLVLDEDAGDARKISLAEEIRGIGKDFPQLSEALLVLQVNRDQRSGKDKFKCLAMFKAQQPAAEKREKVPA